jgi:DNA-binding MarR family transcriptional regulator
MLQGGRKVNESLIVKIEYLDRIAALEDPVSPSVRRTLLHIAKNPDLTASDVAEAMGFGAEFASRVLQKLTNRGWIRSTGDKADGRLKRFGMTADGYAELLRYASAITGEPIEMIQGVKVPPVRARSGR